MKKVTQIKPQNQEKTLAAYKELQEAKSRIDKDLKAIKETLLQMDAGQYGDYVLAFETREVREYVVPARVDTIVKVIKV